MSEQQPADVAPTATDAAGRTFAAGFRAVKMLRPDRPIHPHGVGLVGELVRSGTSGGSGLGWLDAPGTDAVEARFSRSIGLPHALPDILGLGLRISTPGPSGQGTGTADVLFASTGWNFPARFLLFPHLDVGAAALTTLMPYRGTQGPVLLGLKTLQLPPGTNPGQHSRSRPSVPAGRKQKADGSFQEALAAGDWVLGLYCATPSGPWTRCGELRLRAGTDAGADPVPSDTPLRFNPLENTPPGAETYPWTRRLRERSYRAAQQPSPAATGSQGGAGAVLATDGPDELERNKMSTVTQQFNSPAADVWKVIANGWLYSGWVVGASRIRAVDDLWPDAGSRLHHSVGAWPLVIDDSTSVTAVDPGRSLELLARGWPMGEAKVLITLEDQGNGCSVSIAEDAVRGPGRLVPKKIRDAMIAVRNRETLKRLELMAAGGAGT